jgi:hypothetical protein
MENWKRWPDDRRGLYLLLFISLLLKGMMVACSDVVNDDGTLYISAAQEFAKGNFREGLSIYPMPFYSLLIVVSHWVIPQWVLAGQTISFLALGLAVIPLYMTIRLLYGPAEAFWGGMVFAVSPWINGLAGDVVRDPVSLFFFAWALYFGVRAVTGFRTGDFFLSSLACVLALLSRIEAAVFPAAFLFVLFVFFFREREKRFACLAGAGLFLIVPALFFVIFSMVFGYGPVSSSRVEISEYFMWFLNFDFLNSYRSIYDQLKSLEQTMPGWSWSRSFSEVVRYNLWLIYLLGLFQGIFKLLFPLSVLPFAAAVFRRNKNLNKGHFLLLMLSIFYVLAAYVYYVKMNFIDSRYLMVPALLFLPWVGAGLFSLLDWARSTARPGVTTFFLLLVFILTPFGKSMDVLWREEDVAVKEAGLWLGRQPDSHAYSMISTDSRIPFYSGHGVNYNNFPTSNYREMEQVAQSAGLDLLIIAESKKRLTEPPAFEHYEMWKMLEGSKNLALIYRKKS